MLATALRRHLGPDRAVPATMALGAVCGCALIALVDPNESGRYPTCPTRALLGIDCPACGTLRGVHALSRGNLTAALDHNLLLLLAVPVGLVVWLGWVLSALGRPARIPSAPAWVMPALATIAMAFAVARNLPVASLQWLDSSS